MRRRPDSRWHWRPDQSPAAVASKPHFHIPTGVPQLEPGRFHPYPRAPAPLLG